MLARFGLVTAIALSLVGCGGSSQVRSAGSSTVYPFTKAVGDAFVKAKAGRLAPIVESTGTQPGIQRFCESGGDDSFDIADASRRMRKAEYQRCMENKVGAIVEVPIGLDGLALAESNAGPQLELTKKDVYLALAANPMGKPNTAKTWRDVNAKLPAIPIKVFGPPATSGTHDAFVDLILSVGCMEAMPAAKDLLVGGAPGAFDKTCRDIRTDGAYAQQGENDNVIVKALETDQNALGVFGYSYLEQNATRLRGVPIDGIAPSYETISSGKYPGFRVLYLYIKKDHLKSKPDLKDFLDLYATMWEPGGPLTKLGLIASAPSARAKAARIVRDAEALDPMTLN